MGNQTSLAVSSRDRRTLVAALLACVVAGLCHGRAPAVLAFVLSAAGLSLLAVVVGKATEELGSRVSPGVTGVLHSALGNLPELMVCVFSLRAGLIDVVKGALVGSILANSVLVLGAAIFVGGIKNGVLKFQKGPPRMIAVLMLLACSALAIPTLTQVMHTPAASHQASLGLFCSCVLLVVYACSMPFFLKGSEQVVCSDDEPEETSEASWALPFTLAVLGLGAIGSAFVSDWFVEALEPATKALGLSQAFTGLVVVAIAGNAIENLVGIQLALKNKMDYSISVILNSSLQIALMLIPLLVILSFFVGATPLTLVLSPLLLVALLFAAILPAFVVFDGEAIWLEGAALIGLYLLIAAAFWWG